MQNQKDTYTVHTPRGASGIGVIGLKCSDVSRLFNCLRSRTGRRPGRDAGLYYGVFQEPDGRMIDEVLLAWSPGSLRAELTFHGGEAVSGEIARVLAGSGFTRDEDAAFFNVPEWKQQVLDALRSVSTRTGAEHFLSYFSGWYEQELTKAASQLERGNGEAALAVIRRLMQGWNIRNGFINPPTVYITGYPNAGKSTLFNSIAGYERVMVTDIPGTTTDRVEEVFCIQGYPFRFVDTEGLYDGEHAGDMLAEIRKRADYIIYVEEIGCRCSFDPRETAGDKLICRIVNKADTVPAGKLSDCEPGCCLISALDPSGVRKVLDAVYEGAVGIPADAVEQGFFDPFQIETAERIIKALSCSKQSVALSLFRKGFLAA